MYAIKSSPSLIRFLFKFFFIWRFCQHIDIEKRKGSLSFGVASLGLKQLNTKLNFRGVSCYTPHYPKRHSFVIPSCLHLSLLSGYSGLTSLSLVWNWKFGGTINLSNSPYVGERPLGRWLLHIMKKTGFFSVLKFFSFFTTIFLEIKIYFLVTRHV